jgi:crotonobetainyl-CoA:carnitine CoA-transferase CaiB-like acyl-CoA transferase
MGADRPRDWLAGMRVLQLDEHLVTSYAGYLLSELGATVGVVARDRERFEGPDALYALFNAAKPGAALGGGDPDLVLAGPGDAGAPARFAGRVPVAEACFDHADRGLSDLPELLVEALGGWLATNRPASHGYAPVKSGGFQVLLQGGVLLATLALAARRGFVAGGPAQHYRLSLVQLAISILNSLVKVSFIGQEMGTRGLLESQPTLDVECAAGPMHVVAVEDWQFRALCQVLGRPEMADQAEFATGPARFEHYEVLHLLIREALEGRPRAEIVEACAARGVPTVPAFNARDLLVLEQLAARGFWQEREVAGHAMQVPSVPWTAVPTPRRGERGERRSPGAGPLADIRVTETSWVWAGPFASELLAFLGARVTKIESDRHTDFFRRSPGFRSTIANLDTGPSFNQLNLGKKSAVLDLEDERERALVRRLLADSDVFVSNFRPGVLERLGLTTAVLQAVPGLVAARISGYGPSGPWGERVLYGGGAVYVGGLAAMTGSPEQLPVGAGFAFGDPCSGNYTTLAILAALCRRDRNGEGALIDVSILEAIACQATEGFLEQQATGTVRRWGNRHARYAPHGVYQGAGGDVDWLALAVESETQWRAAVDVLALPARWTGWSIAQRREYQDAIDGAIEESSTVRAASDLAAALAARGVPAAAVQTAGQNLRDPAFRACGYLYEIDHPDLGAKTVHGPPWTVDGRRPHLERAPLLGEHTAEVRMNRGDPEP